MSRNKVMLAVPNSGAIHPSVVARVVQLTHDERYDVEYCPARPARPMDRSRAAIARHFLDGQADWLVMIDSDNPPMNNLFDLIAFDKDIMGCPTPVCEYRSDELTPIFWNTWNISTEGFAERIPKDKRVGLMRVSFIGLGCTVIRRKVIETLGLGAFVDERDEHGISRNADDEHFYKQCTAHAFEFWVHWDYCCRHFKGEVDLYNVMQCMEAGATDDMHVPAGLALQPAEHVAPVAVPGIDDQLKAGCQHA